MTFEQEIFDLLENDRLGDAIDFAKEAMKAVDNDLYNTMILLKAQYVSNEKEYSQNLIDRSDYRRTKARIQNGFQESVKRFPKGILAKETIENKPLSSKSKNMLTLRELEGYQELLDMIIEKKIFFQQELLLAIDPNAKHSLKLQLKELERQMIDLKEKLADTSKDMPSSASDLQTIQKQLTSFAQKVEGEYKDLHEKIDKIVTNTEELKEGQAEIIENINELKSLTEAQAQALWKDIAALFFEFDTEMDTKLQDLVKAIKNEPFVKSKLELSIPFIQMLGIDYKVEFDVVAWAKEMYGKYQLKIFKMKGGV